MTKNLVHCRPVIEWHAIALTHGHTHQYLFRRAMVAHVKVSLYDKLKNLF